jgi:hypothetical protein
MTLFKYRCSATGDRIQGFSVGYVQQPSESDYLTVLCTMCQQIHLVNPQSCGRSMSRQGIEWMDKIAFDSMKLSLQLDDSPIGIVDAPSEDRSDVNACKLIYC